MNLTAQGYAIESTNICDYKSLRNVGYTENYSVQKLFSPETVSLISRKVSKLTRGVDPQNRKIVVPDENIYQTLDGVFQGIRRPTGDIYTRYIIPNDQQQDLVQSIIDQTIEVITSNVRNTVGIKEENEKLSAWVQVMGDFSTNGLRQHAPIKTRDKRPSTMQFFQNY